MRYDHTQRGYFHWLLYAFALAVGAAAFLVREQQLEFVFWLLGGLTILFASLGLSFKRLRICDGGDRLEMRFGPLPLLRGEIPYDSITAVEAGRSSIIDGWGIHWIIGRGWTYNLWGFDCVVVRQRNKTIRVGTDDVDGLLAFCGRESWLDVNWPNRR